MDNSGANDLVAILGGAFILVFVLAFFGLYLYSAVWAYGDALLVLLFSWPLGLIMWIVFRPEPKWRS